MTSKQSGQSDTETAAETMAAAMDAIAARETEIGAFAAIKDRGTAISEASKATGPLAGVAIGIKDIFDTHDLPTTYGSPIYEGYRPRSDAAIVTMIRAAGGTIVGKTVSTEFAFLSPGKTRNPRNPAHTPGGSSSGSAAAVAAGMIPFAVGTQTGGSVIRPAAFCGVAAYKPSFRLLPTTGMKTFSWTMDTTGLFARSVSELAWFAACLTSRALEVEAIDPSALRIGIFRSANLSEASDAMLGAMESLAIAAAKAGAQVVDVEEPAVMGEARDKHGTIQDFEAGISMADDFLRHGDRMSDVLRTTLARGRTIRPDDYDAARGIARKARKAATALFANVDILLQPGAPGAAPPGLESTGSPAFNKLWTLCGNPCVNVAGISDESGLPLGVQAIGRFGRDRFTLSAAAWLENLVAER